MRRLGVWGWRWVGAGGWAHQGTLGARGGREGGGHGGSSKRRGPRTRHPMRAARSPAAISRARSAVRTYPAPCAQGGNCSETHSSRVTYLRPGCCGRVVVASLRHPCVAEAEAAAVPCKGDRQGGLQASASARATGGGQRGRGSGTRDARAPLAAGVAVGAAPRVLHCPQQQAGGGERAQPPQQARHVDVAVIISLHGGCGCVWRGGGTQWRVWGGWGARARACRVRGQSLHSTQSSAAAVCMRAGGCMRAHSPTLSTCVTPSSTAANLRALEGGGWGCSHGRAGSIAGRAGEGGARRGGGGEGGGEGGGRVQASAPLSLALGPPPCST